jgi:hypothetical protein
MSKAITPSAALELLLRSAGEFARQRSNLDNSLPYEVFGDLALTLAGRLTDELSEAGIAEAFDCFNILAANGDEDTIELLRSGVFEILCDRTLGIERARANLAPPARRIFDEVAAYYERR